MAEMVKDLVCGMDVDPENAAAQSEHEGTTYYFCAPGCKTDFEASPQKYLNPDFTPEPMGEMAPAGEPEKRWWEFWK